MDLVKIGKYIAKKRTDAGMTQRQLADMLGMSDKSVSKWERGICLPDVSVYSDLCRNLGISINEFLAGEDIPTGDIKQRSEENIISVSADSKKKQKRLKVVIGALLVIILAGLVAAAISNYRANQPQNFITPADKNSIEMETAEILSGPGGAFIYHFTTDYKAFTVKLIFVADGYRIQTEAPILEAVDDREYYGRGASEITEKTQVRYNEEQALLALIYDNDTMRTVSVDSIIKGQTKLFAENDYMYFFAFEFRK